VLVSGAEVVAPLEAGLTVARRDLEAMLGAVILGFMFGHVSAVRPSCVISLQHPWYKVSLNT